MAFGLVLGFLNARFFRSAVDTFTIAIPQLVFLSAIFIYLCVLIVAKWIIFWVEPKELFGGFYYYPGGPRGRV